MHTFRSVASPLFFSMLFSGCSTRAVSRAITFQHVGIQPIQFNQTALSKAAADGISPSKASRPPIDRPIFENPQSVLRFILVSSPDHPIVYPTERYYYYYFPLGSRLVSGNIRFADAERGGISIGYFDTHNEDDMHTGEFHDGKDGVRIEYRAATHEVALSFGGVSRVFLLDQGAFEPPAYPLLNGEEVVSGVRDESGYYLHLIYWRPGRSFYYVLNPHKPVPETWSRGETDKVEVWWGDHSRYCFLHEPHTGRFILVGVNQREIRENTWYDGPFDQVPPNLPIKTTLEEAYPYVKDAGGIDEHGNFLNMHGQRVAISPYQEYESGPEFEHALERLVRDTCTPEAWTAATYEYKRDWRPNMPMPAGGHRHELSSAWPANHWGSSSASWGRHDQAVSTKWPPSHAAESSTAGHY